MLDYGLIDQLPIAFWASQGARGGYEIVIWSKGAEKIYGISRSQAVGKRFTTLFVAPEARSRAERSADEVIAGVPHRANSIALDRTPGGEERLLLTNVFPLEWRGDTLHAEVAVDLTASAIDELDERARDQIVKSASVGISELMAHRREQDLQHSMVRLRGMAHETRSELTMIRSALLTLSTQLDANGPPTLKAVVSASLDACERSAAVVETTLVHANHGGLGTPYVAGVTTFHPGTRLKRTCERYSGATGRIDVERRPQDRRSVQTTTLDWDLAISNLVNNATRHGDGRAVVTWFLPPGGDGATAELTVVVRNAIAARSRDATKQAIAEALGSEPERARNVGLATVKLLAERARARFSIDVEGSFVIARLDWPCWVVAP